MFSSAGIDSLNLGETLKIEGKVRIDYMKSPVLSTCPLHTGSGCVGKRDMVISTKVALVRDCLEVYWPCAGGLSAVNAIGTQLRDPINSGLSRLRMAVLNK